MHARRPLLAPLVVATLLSSASFAADPPGAEGIGGAVVSGEADATAAGIELLAAGGNAVDAAVATALALAVVHPEAGNLGGGGLAVVRIGGELATLDFRETAPAAATRDLFVDAEGLPVPDASTVGPLAAGVPGTPAGLWELHRRFGKKPWPEVVAPAIRLARDGFVLSRRFRRSLERAREKLSRFPETTAVWFRDGAPLPAGTRVRLPRLAATLEAYAAQGPDAIVRGDLARAIEQISSRYGGILTVEELAEYRPVWREPVRFGAWGWELAGMDLPSSGGLVTETTFGLLLRLGWADHPRFGAERAHLLVEAWRRAYADRFLLGDPGEVRLDPAALLAPDRLDRLAASIDPTRAAASAEIVPGALREPLPAPADTTHVAVVDAAGNAASLTTTLNGLFGGKLWVPEGGFFLNNEMDDFAAAPGQPNQYGLIQGDANAVRPGRRMLSSMSPTLAWRPDGEILAVGGRGGSRIISGTIQVLMNVLVDGDPLQTAVDRPRLHHQWLPDVLETEDDTLSPETAAELRRRGHTLGRTELDDRPKINAARYHPDGWMETGADPRGPATGAVVTPFPIPIGASAPPIQADAAGSR